MIHKWSDIRLSDVRAINSRLAIAKFHNWQKDIESWSKEQYDECVRYGVMMTNIERDWEYYADLDVQQLYDAATLCYLLLDGHMAGINRDGEILRLTKTVYKIKD